jgi:peroxiredoxin
MSLSIGSPAPEFTLKSNQDNEISLADYKGNKNVVLVFYPLDFSPVCSIQLPEYSGKKADFEAKDTVVLGVNRDSVYTHKAWAKEFGIEVPLLADMNGATAKSYGIYLDEAGINKRAVFLIDKEGVLRFKFIEKSPGDFTLHTDEVLKEISKL